MIKLQFKDFTAEFSTPQEAAIFVRELESIKTKRYGRNELVVQVEGWLKTHPETFTTVELATYLYGHSLASALNPTRKCLIRLEKEGKVISDGLISTSAPRRWTRVLKAEKSNDDTMTNVVLQYLEKDPAVREFWVADVAYDLNIDIPKLVEVISELESKGRITYVQGYYRQYFVLNHLASHE